MYCISISWPRAKGKLWQPLKYSKGHTLEKAVYIKRNQNENQLNEKKNSNQKMVHACIYNKTKDINCGKIPPAEIDWFNYY